MILKIKIFQQIPEEENLFYQKKQRLYEKIEGVKIKLLEIFKKIPDMKEYLFPKHFGENTPGLDFLHPFQKNI